MTGWTVKDKLSYYRNIILNKLYSMRGTLLLGSNSSSYKDLMLIKLQYEFKKIEKSLLTWRQFA